MDRVGLGVDQLAAIPAEAWLPTPLLLGAASLLLLGGYVLSGALWGRIVRDLGGPPVAAPDAVRIFMIANLGRYVPGKVWQIAGLAALGRSRGVPATTGAAAAVLGQGIALVAAGGIGAIAFLSGPEQYRPAGIVGLAAVGALIVVCAVPGLYRRLATAWLRLARTEAPETLSGSQPLVWLAAYGVNWVIYATAFWVLCLSLGVDAAPVAIASAFAAAYVLGYAMIFAPAGLGPREGFLIAFLSPHFGVATSGVVAVVARIWTTLVEVVPAALFWARFVSAPAATGSVEPLDAGAGEAADG